MMEALIKILGVTVLFVAIVIIGAFPVMWLWNWLMPVIFMLPRISIWQAVGLSFLSKLLFGTDVKINKK